MGILFVVLLLHCHLSMIFSIPPAVQSGGARIIVKQSQYGEELNMYVDETHWDA